MYGGDRTSSRPIGGDRSEQGATDLAGGSNDGNRPNRPHLVSIARVRAVTRRRRAEELKTLLIDAGLRVLYRRGLRATASHVPMTEATKELEATHGIEVGMGSIFGRGRLWANVGEFQLDLLRAAIEDTSSGGPNDESLALIHHLPDMRNEPFEDRLAMLIELCRIAGSMNGYIRAEPSKGRSWELWVSIWATAMADAEVADRLIPSLRAEEVRTVGSFSAVYEIMLQKLRLRPRAPYTLDQMSMLAAALTDGVALRAAIAPDMVSEAASPHNDESWNLLGVGLTALAREFLEDDPTPD